MAELLFEDARDHKLGLVDLFRLVLEFVVCGQSLP
jgi:hypothetical protein